MHFGADAIDYYILDRLILLGSQTDGVDLPEMHQMSGDPGENLERLAAFLRGRGIELGYKKNIAPALGISYGGRIALLPGQSKAEEFSTLVHETAHETAAQGRTPHGNHQDSA
jgi:hypothetical protein